MSDYRPELPPPPINEATLKLAHELHGELVRDLERINNEPIELGLDERLATYREAYPNLLFGELAMYLAGVQLKPNATAPDRARGIAEALRKIATTPSLFESITNAPFSQELAGGLVPRAPARRESAKEEPAYIKEIREKVGQVGYLERSFFKEECLVQLEYDLTTTIKDKRWRKKANPYPPDITIKLSPSDDLEWTINQYEHWDDYNGYYGYMDSRLAVYGDMFTVVSVDTDSDAPIPKKLLELSGKPVRVGRVSTGSQLKVGHAFSMHTKEVPGYNDRGLLSASLSLPFVLRQAYIGDSKDHPLFEN